MDRSQMKIIVLMLILLVGCEARRGVDFKVGDCALGGSLGVWKLTKKEQGKYLFVAYPVQEGAALEVVEDISVLKKIDCPR